VASLGGFSEIASPWPIPVDDHPMHFHNAWVSRTFLPTTGTTAGYDPYFMAGYPKSVVSDPSGTMIESVLAFAGETTDATVYKRLIVFLLVTLPVWVSLAARAWGGSPEAATTAVLLYLVYLWIDFPLAYAAFGMVAFLVVVPVGLLVAAALVRYLEGGGIGRWLVAAAGSAILLWVHPLCLMFLGPAAGLGYLRAAFERDGAGRRMSVTRHLGLWMIPVVALALNAWWWLPAIELAATGMAQDIAFIHEPAETLPRLAEILGLRDPAQPVIQVLLLAGSVVGLAALYGAGRVRRFTLGVVLAAGFFWGYLSGLFPALKPLQPGRHTYTFYTTAALVAGLGWGRLALWLRDLGRPWMTRLAVAGALLIGVRLFAAELNGGLAARTGLAIQPGNVGGKFVLVRRTSQRPFLSSQPSPPLIELVDAVKTHFTAGDRLYYEEGGQARPGTDGFPPLGDPFGGRRFGGLLPRLTGVEVVGGPFLNMPLKTNFTQVGMGRLFGENGWDGERFDRYARLYRPEGVIAWSPEARRLIEDRPDRFEIIEALGPYLIARVKGYEGAAIRGEAEVEATAGRLVVRMKKADDVDGKVVLRYHTAPGIGANPPIALEEEFLEDDPVPFIRLPYSVEPITLELRPSLP
jgi:hypothetical protein